MPMGTPDAPYTPTQADKHQRSGFRSFPPNKSLIEDEQKPHQRHNGFSQLRCIAHVSAPKDGDDEQRMCVCSNPEDCVKSTHHRDGPSRRQPPGLIKATNQRSPLRRHQSGLLSWPLWNLDGPLLSVRSIAKRARPVAGPFSHILFGINYSTEMSLARPSRRHPSRCFVTPSSQMCSARQGWPLIQAVAASRGSSPSSRMAPIDFRFPGEQ